jgi:hypothetical protein
MKILEIEVKSKGDELALLRANNKSQPSKEEKEALCKHLDANPELWQKIGDFAGRIQDRIIGDSASDSFLAQESYRRRLAKMRDALGWQTVTEAERILIEQVCLNWIRLNFMEAVHREKLQKSHSVRDGIYFEKMLDGAQKRFTRACEALAKVKKLTSETNFWEERLAQKRMQGVALANQLATDLERQRRTKPAFPESLADLASEIL